jgi:tetratricopeptide (TPR) repeat protein
VRVIRSAAVALRVICVALMCACVGGSAGPEGSSSPEPDTAGVAPVVARAEAAVAQGDFDTGIDAYREAYERTPWNTRLQSALAAAYAGRAAKLRTKPGGAAGLALADGDLREALVISPDQPELERSLAAVLLDRASFARDDDEAAAFRAEADGLAPDLVAQTPLLRMSAERRLDVAFDLLERGQLDAGIDQLEALVSDDPESTAGVRLLAQALVRKGGVQRQRADYEGASRSYARAVTLYAQLLPCDGTRCDAAELELAHRNRIHAALDGANYAEARAALTEAQGLGLDFGDLEARWPELKTP